MPEHLSYLTRFQRYPSYVFLLSSVVFLVLVWTSPFLGPFYLFLLCFFSAFHFSIIAPNGKEWGDQRRQLFFNSDKASDFSLPSFVKHHEEYMENSRGMLIYTQTWEPNTAKRSDQEENPLEVVLETAPLNATQLKPETIASIAFVPSSPTSAISLPPSSSSSSSPPSPKALILMLHGYADHASGLKHLICQWLCSEGYIVCGLDYEGHGRSDGLHVSIPSFKPIIEDILQYIQLVRRRYGSTLPLFIYAESMGGAICYLLATQHPQLFAGAIMSAPMSAIAPEMHPPWIVTQILLLVMRFFPTLPITPTPDVAAYAFKRKDIYEQVKHSVVYYGRMPRLSTAANMLFSSIDISLHLNKMTIPFIILHGTDDKVTDPKMSQLLFEQAESKDKTIKLYKGAYHSLLIGEEEPMVKQVKEDMIHWLEERIPQNTKNSINANHITKQPQNHQNGITNSNSNYNSTGINSGQEKGSSKKKKR